MVADPVVELVIVGTPGTAGSKSAFPIKAADGHIVRINMVEKDPQHVKRNWRSQIIDQVRTAYACDCAVPGCAALRPPFPLDEALVASMVFTVKKPVSAPKTVRSWPSARPDTIKYTRATEDALTAAGLLKDDARIVRYVELAKVYPGEDPGALPTPGARIRLWRMAELTTWQRDALSTDAVDLTMFDLMTPGR